MRSLLWFVLGCMVGGLAVAGAFTLWILVEEPPPVVVVDAGPPCPDFPFEKPPWLPETQAKDIDRPVLLDVPASLEPRVQFWEKLWGVHADRVYLLADRRVPWVVHSLVDCRSMFADGDSAAAENLCDRRLIAAKKRVIQRLNRQRRRPGPELLAQYGGQRKLVATAARHILVIQGLRGRLDQALNRGAHALVLAEHVFAMEGVPPALARLAIIESLFEADVASPAGAVGAFQFVVDTAREYLQVDPFVDERLDPLRSSWAAARYLDAMHREFGDWPLTVTAYNTGPTRLRRLLGRGRNRDLGRLVAATPRGGFGFDGQNYFAQLAAVVRVTQSWQPPTLPPAPRVLRMVQPLPLDRLAACVGVDIPQLIDHNPALTDLVTQQGADIPLGTLIAVPAAELALESPQTGAGS
ncbi:MAG: transglycosylase SLT domain-containing protein [Pseudomonadota bacterium]